MKPRIAPIAPLVLLLAACGSPAEESPAASGATEETTASGPDAAPPAEPPAITDIPQAMRGRWGLVEADCDPTRDDAKGLMTVDAESLAFYESRGSLEIIEDADEEMLLGTFAFTGEGQSWQQDMRLELEDGGRKLVRTLAGEPDAGEPLEYSRCS